MTSLKMIVRITVACSYAVVKQLKNGSGKMSEIGMVRAVFAIRRHAEDWRKSQKEPRCYKIIRCEKDVRL